MRRNWSAPVDPAQDTGWAGPPARKGFFTDSSICIGCKACEVACKEWNGIPRQLSLLGMSYDNTGALGASTWRHVAFIERRGPARSGGFTSLPMVADTQATTRGGCGHCDALADVVGRVQALHQRGLPRRLPDRVA